MPPPESRLVYAGLQTAIETISGNVPVAISIAPRAGDPAIGYFIIDPLPDRRDGSLAGDLPHLAVPLHLKAVSDHPLKTANLLDHAAELLEDPTTVTVSGRTVTRVRREPNGGTPMDRDDSEGTIPLFWKADRYTIEVQ